MTNLDHEGVRAMLADAAKEWWDWCDHRQVMDPASDHPAFQRALLFEAAARSAINAVAAEQMS
jgi:hypothetical protein